MTEAQSNIGRVAQPQGCQHCVNNFYISGLVSNTKNFSTYVPPSPLQLLSRNWLPPVRVIFLYAYSYNIRINTFICLHEDPVSVFVQKYRLLEGKLQAS